MSKTHGGYVRIRIVRIQDGVSDIEEYQGNIKEINNRLNVTFSEISDDGTRTAHLLKADSDSMEWIREGDIKTKTVFKAGSSLPFLFSTPHGSIHMKLTTHDYSYIKKDTHEICVSYSIDQGENMISDYETRISIFADY